MPQATEHITETRQLPKLSMRAAFAPDSINEEARTVELIWSTGARVLRHGWDGPFYEELSMDPRAIRMDRLRNGAPLLTDHRSWSVDAVVGVVEKASVANGEGRATVRFSRREDADRVFQDVRDGIVRNISVGYRIHKLEKVEEVDRVPVMRATDWEPFEISVVAVGADADAGFRSAEQQDRYDVEVLTPRAIGAQQPEPETMTDEVRNEPAATESAATRNQPEGQQVPQVDEARIRREAQEAERNRISEIRRAVRTAKLGDDVADTLISEGVEIDEARSRIFDLMAEQDEETDTRSHVRVEVVREEAQTRREAVTNALLHRFNPGQFQLEEHGREWRGMSLGEMAREFCELNGVSVRGLGRAEIAARALHSTSDFPEILANVANSTLRAAYDAAPRTFAAWGRRVSLPDFKEVRRVQLGEAPELKKVNEHGEFTRGSIGEGKEAYQLATYGRVFGITRQVIVNDDLDAFTRIPALFGRAAAELESDLVYGHLIANPTMGDGKALFHADHKNFDSTGAALSIAALSAARAAMRKQKGLDGKQFINVQAKHLLVPAELETVAQQILTGITANDSSKVNPFSGAYTMIVEPRLDGDSSIAWYLVADPAAIDTLEYGYLDGQDGVYIETRNGFDVDGLEIKARLDFGCKVIDWRSFYKNKGAAQPS